MFLKCRLSPITMEGHGPSVEQLSTRTFVKSACAGNDDCEASWSNTFRVLSLHTMCAESMAAWCTADMYFVCSKSVKQLLIWCAFSQSLPLGLNKSGVVSCCVSVLVFLSLFQSALSVLPLPPPYCALSAALLGAKMPCFEPSWRFVSRGDCHVMVVSDRYRAETGYRTRSIHPFLTVWSVTIGFEPSLRRKFFGDLGLLDLRPDHGVSRPWFYGNCTACHRIGTLIVGRRMLVRRGKIVTSCDGRFG